MIKCKSCGSSVFDKKSVFNIDICERLIDTNIESINYLPSQYLTNDLLKKAISINISAARYIKDVDFFKDEYLKYGSTIIKHSSDLIKENLDLLLFLINDNIDNILILCEENII